MQSSIKNQTGEYTVLGNAEALKNGVLKATDLPEIRIWQDADGKLWTLDHRRLAAFRIAELDSVPFRWATDEEVTNQMWKMTTKTNGISVKLKLGNGQSMTDPFGLSPLSNISWKSHGHALLNGLGMIPGIGDAFDLVNAVWYLADGDYKNVLLSGMSALPLLGDTVGAGMNIMGASKAAKFVKTASRAISYGATFVQASGGAVNGVKDVYRNIKDGKFFTKQNAVDMAGLAINTFTTLCSRKAAYKYGNEAGNIAKMAVSDAWSSVKGKAKNIGSSIKNHLSEFHHNNGGYLNFGGREW